jgi:hypothetical protein
MSWLAQSFKQEEEKRKIQTEERKRNAICYNCNRKGHFKANCPDKNGFKCDYCGIVGHKQRNCAQKFKDENSGNSFYIV